MTRTKGREQQAGDGTVTLEAYVARYPSQDEAALVIGVRTETLNRWLNKRRSPRGLAVKRLRELGIKV